MSTVKRKCRVVMLPTQKASNIVLSRGLQGKLFFPVVNLERDDETLQKYINAGSIPQHLYILSDDKPEEGDWVILSFGGNGLVCQMKEGESGGEKIIATTDVLGFVDDELSKSMGGKVERRLPQPSQGFIQKCIEAYNNGKPIEEVIVDYEVKDYTIIRTFPRGFETNYNPKINQKDNTITISKVKDSWTREEVEALLTKLYYEDLHLVGGRFEEWIKDNLK